MTKIHEITNKIQLNDDVISNYILENALQTNGHFFGYIIPREIFMSGYCITNAITLCYVLLQIMYYTMFLID